MRVKMTGGLTGKNLREERADLKAAWIKVP